MKDTRLKWIDAVRVEDGKAYILGCDSATFHSYHSITHELASGTILEEDKFTIGPNKSENYNNTQKLFEEKNIADLENL